MTRPRRRPSRRPSSRRTFAAGPRRDADHQASLRVVAAAVARRPRRPPRRHRVDPRRDDVHHDAGRPLQADPRRRPDLRRRHTDRWRHGITRVGPGVSARPPAAELPAQWLEHGLVRRSAGLPLLHGRPGAGDGWPRHGAPVRRRLQARRHLRARLAAVHVLGVRTARSLPLPGAGAVRLRRAVPSPSTRARRSTAATCWRRWPASSPSRSPSA